MKPDQKMYFLAGLPRSGTTLLGAILGQNPDFYVSATSALPGLLAATHQTFEESQFTKVEEIKSRKLDVLKNLVSGFYEKIPQQIIIDKNRAWAFGFHIENMEKVLGTQVKVICPVRPIADVLASFVSIMNRNGGKSHMEADLVQKGFPLTDRGRCDYLMHPQYGTVRQAYEWMKQTYESPFKDRLFFLEYDDLVTNPQAVIEKIYRFLELPLFQHDFQNIKQSAPEDDEASYGLPGLHFIRPQLAKTSQAPKNILGEKLWTFYQGGEFWNNKPGPVYEKSVLDMQLEAGLRGDFELGWKLAQLAADDDDRAQFNKGWYLMMRGQLQEGIKLLDRGRRENVFGNRLPSPLPIWDGRRLNGETVLLNCEGGLGDQICNARFAKDISLRGGNVVLGCQAELAPLLSKISGVSAVIESSVAGAIYHSFVVPGMSAVKSLGYEYGDLDGSAYLHFPQLKKTLPGTKLKVGIRWAGNPAMQHDIFRRFDPQFLFNLKDVDLVCLQKEWEGEIPKSIRQPSLNTWEQTAAVISDLDLVITSCTSIAHLAGAMGKPTWIVVPILPYYLWSLPGDQTPWYQSMKIFRQVEPMKWDQTFEKINVELSQLVQNLNSV